MSEAKTSSRGKSPGRRVSRAKPLKRRSIHGGDSMLRALEPTDIKAREKEIPASFLQYCAMCEKQIMTPSSSILYCSEACRRKDSVKPLSASTIASPPGPSSMPSTPRPTLPMRVSSTSPEDFTSFVRIPSDLHDHKSDLDPTEWKPKLQHHSNSEAFRYLSRFHQNMTTLSDGNEHLRLERPPIPRHKSATSVSMSMGTTPSLGTTPTTVASSFESTYDFNFNLRPLPLRQNPLYSTSAGVSRGIDLVTPHIPPPVDVAGSSPVRNTFDNDFWGKKVVVPGTTPRGNGLGALFGKDP